ncbi:uncharacterized protein KGF55_004420 [Candida pseudojiufengensis]|uniref:uncharacterized protein n=1 Tax=Candida pseudojiufengensis TaxID=497109 RepID=UPI0022247751|nr:uncharacterized protein KGF55_004420 [Candida pseudojiufengensis]KAI5960850.1 hypothetical protein KGF55_004420 [Candida pseudojiufengensis]
MPTLYTGPTGNGRKPTILIKLLNAPIDIHLFEWPTKEIKQQWYLDLNPNGTQPTLVDDSKNLKLFESNALLQYIAVNYDKDHKYYYSESDNFNLYWEQYTWLYYQGCQFAAFNLARAITHINEGHNDKFTEQDVIKGFKQIYEILENQLIKNKSGWLIGNKFTIVDISFGCGNHRRIEKSTNTNFDIKNFDTLYPNVVKWYNNFLSIDGIKEILDKK